MPSDSQWRWAVWNLLKIFKNKGQYKKIEKQHKMKEQRCQRKETLMRTKEKKKGGFILKGLDEEPGLQDLSKSQ